MMIFHSGALLLVHFEFYDKSDLQSLMHQRVKMETVDLEAVKVFKMQEIIFVAQPDSASFARYMFRCFLLA